MRSAIRSDDMALPIPDTLLVEMDALRIMIKFDIELH
jgi:hypothetical protein